MHRQYTRTRSSRPPSPPPKASRLQPLIDFLSSNIGLARYRQVFEANMRFKRERYEHLYAEADRDCSAQLDALSARVGDLKRRADVQGQQDNWAIFESVSSGYRDATERKAKFMTLRDAAESRRQDSWRDATALRDELVASLNVLSTHDAQSHIIDCVADIVGAFIKDPALFRKKPLNMMLVGSPGSGKTTLAAAIGKVFARAGMFVGDRLIEAGRAELVAQYEGQTVARTRSFLMDHLDGGVIFVDEAYAITPWTDGRPEGYGAEAACAIVEFMTRYQGLYCIMVAGYEREMLRYFLNANEGLARRFPYKFVLRDLTVDELVSVFKRQLVMQQDLDSDDATQGESYFTKEAWRYLARIVQIATTGVQTYGDEFDPNVKQTFRDVRRFVPQNPLLFSLFANQAGSMVTLAEETIQVLIALLPFAEGTWRTDRVRPRFGPHGVDVMRSILTRRISNTALSASSLFLNELMSAERSSSR